MYIFYEHFFKSKFHFNETSMSLTADDYGSDSLWFIKQAFKHYLNPFQ